MVRSAPRECRTSRRAAPRRRSPGPRDFPGVRSREPVIRLLTLPAVAHGLLEDAVFSAGRTPCPECRVSPSNRGSTRQAAEPPLPRPASGSCSMISSGSILCFLRLTPDRVEQQIGDVVRQRAAHQEFERQVIDAFDIPGVIRLLDLDPSLRRRSRMERAIASNLSRGVAAAAGTTLSKVRWRSYARRSRRRRDRSAVEAVKEGWGIEWFSSSNRCLSFHGTSPARMAAVCAWTGRLIASRTACWPADQPV